MPKLTSAVDPQSQKYKSLHAHNSALVAELRDHVAKAARGGSDKSRERHVARGKLLPRDRVERLLDPGSPFLRSDSWPPTACMTARRRLRASSPGSGGFRAERS